MFSWNKHLRRVPRTPVAYRAECLRHRGERRRPCAHGANSLLPRESSRASVPCQTPPTAAWLTVRKSLGAPTWAWWAGFQARWCTHTQPQRPLVTSPPKTGTPFTPEGPQCLRGGGEGLKSQEGGRCGWGGEWMLSSARCPLNMAMASAGLSLARSRVPHAASSVRHPQQSWHFTGAVLSWFCERRSALLQRQRG